MRRLLCALVLTGVASMGQAPPQPPKTVPGTPPTPKPEVQTPPPQAPAKPQAEHDTGGDVLSIEPFFWLTSQNPVLQKSHNAPTTLPGTFDFNGDKRYAYGGILTIPTGHENSLQFTYFRKQAQGNSTLTQDSAYFANEFFAGDVVASHYTLQNIKVSWNYLTYPYPSNGAKLRIKTLWEVQYVTIHSVFDAPADTNTSTTEGRKSIVLPTLGLGIEYHAGKHVRFELKGSGFGIPHHAALWDTEGSLVLRASRIEFLIGGKAFHFKTSPQKDNYFSDTLYGPYAGLRYMFK